MRKTIFSVLLLVCLFAGAAWADEQTILYCVDMPYCCEFSCIMADFECDYCCPSESPLRVEFLDRTKAVLGTAEFGPGWCYYCDEMVAHLDTAVNSSAVCYVRLIKADSDCSCFWMSLRVFCDDPCSCGKWYLVYKGDVWCWEKVPVPAPVPEPEVAVEPPPVVVPDAPPPAEPKPDFDYFPEPAPEPEIIIVEGRG